MKLWSRHLGVIIVLVGVLALGTVGQAASVGRLPDGFPERTINLIAPYGFGGGWDMFGRALALGSKSDTTQVNVINMPGGGGVVAMNFVNSEPADGYTVLGIEGSMVIGEITGRTELSMLTHFIPLLKVVETPMGIFVLSDSPYQTFDDLVAAVKADPEGVVVGGSDTGALFNVGTIQVFKNAGADVKYLSFADEPSRMLPAALGGHVDAVFDVISVFHPLMESGDMRALAVTSDERLPMYPDVPTLKELGYGDGVPKHWRGVAVHRDTPPERIRFIEDMFRRGADSAFFRSTVEDALMNVVPTGGEELVAMMEEERETYRAILQELGFSE